MERVVGHRDQVRQDVAAAAGVVLQLEEAAARRFEEQIVLEEAGVDRQADKEVGLVHAAFDEHHGNAHGIEPRRRRVGVVHGDAGAAGRGAVDDQQVGGRAGPAEKRIDRQRGVAGAVEPETSAARRFGEVEYVIGTAIDHGDQPLVLEPLEADEIGPLAIVELGCRAKRAARSVEEQIAPAAEIAGLPGVELTAGLVDEGVPAAGEIHEAGNQPRVVDHGPGALGVDGKPAPRRDRAAIGDLGGGHAVAVDAHRPGGDVAGVLNLKGRGRRVCPAIDADAQDAVRADFAAVGDGDGAIRLGGRGEDADGIEAGRGDVAAIHDTHVVVGPITESVDAVGIPASGRDIAAVDHGELAVRSSRRRVDALRLHATRDHVAAVHDRNIAVAGVRAAVDAIGVVAPRRHAAAVIDRDAAVTCRRIGVDAAGHTADRREVASVDDGDRAIPRIRVGFDAVGEDAGRGQVPGVRDRDPAERQGRGGEDGAGVKTRDREVPAIGEVDRRKETERGDRHTGAHEHAVPIVGEVDREGRDDHSLSGCRARHPDDERRNQGRSRQQEATLGLAGKQSQRP